MWIAVNLALAAAAQSVDQAAVWKAAKALAGADAAARREAEAFLEALPSTNMTWIRSGSARQESAIREALDAWLPHPIWWGVLRGSIGDVRRRERELLGESGPRTLAAVARAAAGLLEREGPDRLLGLQLLENAPAPDPAALKRWTEAKDAATVRPALRALARIDVPAALAAARKRLDDEAEDVVRAAAEILGAYGAPDETPALVEALRAQPERGGAIVGVLAKIGDARAEDALIEALAAAPQKERHARIDALAHVGGEKALDVLRRLRESVPAEERKGVERGLLRLRDRTLLREAAAAGRWDGGFEAVGDAEIAKDLATSLTSFKVRDRSAAVEYVGLFGAAEHLELLLEHLKDDRFKEAAAVGLGELGDARAAKPLAAALATAGYGSRIPEVLARLPLEGARETLAEILDDPEGHRPAYPAAIGLAGRAGGDALRARLLRIVTAEKTFSLWGHAAARAVAPLLRPADRDVLRAALKTRRYSLSVELALAHAGDPAGVDALLRKWTEGGAGDLRTLDPELILGAEPEGWVERLEASIRNRPDWVAPRLLLAAKKRPEAADVLRRELRSSSSMRREAAAALLHYGDPKDVAEILRGEDYAWDVALEERLAAAMDEAAAERLRERAWAQAYYSNQGPARLLARRADPAMAPFFRRTLAREYGDNEVSPQSNVPAAAEALAALRDRDAAPLFRRMLRSTAPGRRALGARCLARLEGAAAIPDLLPLLDDGGEVPGDRLGAEPTPSPGRVRDLTAAALETLAKAPFPGTGRARVEAARAWARKGN